MAQTKWEKEGKAGVFADNLIAVLRTNHIKPITNMLNTHGDKESRFYSEMDEQPILSRVLDEAIKMNNDDQLDLTILEALIRSNKFDISAEQFQLAKTEGAKHALRTYLAS